MPADVFVVAAHERKNALGPKGPVEPREGVRFRGLGLFSGGDVDFAGRIGAECAAKF